MATITGGDKARAALDRIAKNLSNAKSVEVGFMEGATYPDGTSVPLVAALNEFGHVIMPRSKMEMELMQTGLAMVKTKGKDLTGLQEMARASLRKKQIEAGAVVPPRPYFRRMIQAKSKGWPAGIAEQLKQNDYDAHKALDATGEAVEGQLRQSINELMSPPLAASTIAKKGHAKPLIDSSVMINSATHRVKT